MLDNLSLLLTLAGSLLAVLPKAIEAWTARRTLDKVHRIENVFRDDKARSKALESLLAGKDSHQLETIVLSAKEDEATSPSFKILVSASAAKAASGSMQQPTTATRVLSAFAAVVVLFACVAVWRYWPQVKALGDTIFLAVGLLLTMVAGMFVQVITSNYREDRSLLDVTPSRLLFPLLFSPIVFYPIWLVGDREGAGAFSFYAAFLNGYFWQSVVSAVKQPRDKDA